ncbi:ABC transporter ATP-binding protein [Thermomonas brevis]
MEDTPSTHVRTAARIETAPSVDQSAQDASTPGRGSLRTRGVGKTVALPDGPLTILDGIDLHIAPGERVAIVGESGSGKTTLLSLLAGLDVPTTGEVWLDGQPIHAAGEDARAALRAEAVGFVFQNFQLMPAMSALDNVALPLELRGKSGAAAARDLLAKVGLGQRLHHLPRQLSGGEQQRVAIARAFVAAPRILFADEPTGNLDRKTGLAIEDLLFDMDDARAITVVVVTHDERLAARCDRQLRLDAGRLVA